MRQFSYHGKRLESIDEHDINGLEREIEFILKNSKIGASPLRAQTGHQGLRVPLPDSYELGAGRRTKTAGVK